MTKHEIENHPTVDPSPSQGIALGRSLLSDKELRSMLPTDHLVGLDETVLWQDIIVLTSTRYPQAERWIAAQWIAYCWFRTPIARQRWQAVGPSIKRVLSERAQVAGTNPGLELRASVVQALFITGDDPFEPSKDEPRQAFLRRLNDLVCADLLGPDWRSQPTVDIGDLENVLESQADFPGEVETAIEFERLVARAGLGEKEARVLRTVCDARYSDEIASNLDLSPGAFRTALSRARAKMKKAWVGM